MQYSDSINVTNFKTILTNIVMHPSIKAFVALLAGVYNWLFGIHTEAIIVLISLVILDTITGMMKAIKCYDGISSKGFFRLCVKFSVYAIMVANCSLLDKALPITFAASTMFSFLSVTEGISIMENLSSMGFPIPSKITKMLYTMRKGDDEV